MSHTVDVSPVAVACVQHANLAESLLNCWCKQVWEGKGVVKSARKVIGATIRLKQRPVPSVGTWLCRQGAMLCMGQIAQKMESVRQVSL